MGVSIRVFIDPACVGKAAWARIFEQTVTVLRRWPDPPIRPAVREVAGVEVRTYVRDVIDPAGWHICGDANSRLTAESIELPRTLGVDAPQPEPTEFLLRVLATYRPPYDYGGLRTLLDNKTQGRPFHLLVLAVAMLIEHHLPGCAFADGDFSAEEARVAKGRLRELLGEDVALPVCTQPKLLAERLCAHLGPSELPQAVELLSCRGPLAAVLIGMFSGSLGSPGSHQRLEIERAVACTDVSTLDPLTRQAFEFFVGQAKTLFGRTPVDDPSAPPLLPAEFDEFGKSELLPLIARRTTTSYLFLTEMAWHDIQRASLAELRLLAMLASHQTSGLVAHQLRRAVFESVAIRRFCMEAWDTAEPVVPQDYPIRARLFDEARV